MKVLTIFFLLIPFISCTNNNQDTANELLIAEENYYREATTLQDSIYFSKISTLKELADFNPNKYKLYLERAERIANRSDSISHELQLKIDDPKKIEELILTYIEYCFHWADVSYVYEIPSLESLMIFANEKVLRPYVQNKYCQASFLNHVTLLIKVAKIDLVKHLISYPAISEQSYNNCFPVIISNRNTISVGERFDAMIALCAADTTLVPKILISIDNENMKEIDVTQNGTGTISKVFDRPGEKQINGVYKLSWWGFGEIEMPFSTTVSVK
jgi:hypothetical protein